MASWEVRCPSGQERPESVAEMLPPAFSTATGLRLSGVVLWLLPALLLALLFQQRLRHRSRSETPASAQEIAR